MTNKETAIRIINKYLKNKTIIDLDNMIVVDDHDESDGFITMLIVPDDYDFTKMFEAFIKMLSNNEDAKDDVELLKVLVLFS